MSNPAGTLLEILRRWDQPSEAPIRVRQPNSDAAIRDHLVAMHCLWEISSELDYLDKVGRLTRPWRNALPRWVGAVLAYPVGWGTDQSGDRLYDEPTVLDPLETLADALETRSLAGEMPTTEGVDELLAEARELLRDDATLDPILRAYIGRLLEECRRALEDVELFGSFDLDEGLRRLWVAVGAAADKTTDEGLRARWRAFRDQAAPAIAAGMLTNAPSWIEAIQRAVGQ